jgi:hypothetical protein
MGSTRLKIIINLVKYGVREAVQTAPIELIAPTYDETEHRHLTALKHEALKKQSKKKNESKENATRKKS